MIKIYSFVLFLSLSPYSTIGAMESVDPLNSPRWDDMHNMILDNGPVIFDKRVVVVTPDFAEDPMNVPVSVSVTGLGEIEEIIVFADLNPIQKILRFQPVKLAPYLAFRIKVEQGTPVRAAVKTADGFWHVGGKWLEAAGGGCTAPSTARSEGGWEDNLMETAIHAWENQNDYDRVRLRIMHPMDTGLADGIPAFYIQELTIRNEYGETFARLDTYQPISENPVFTFNMNTGSLSENNLILYGNDNNGNLIQKEILR